MLKSQNAIWVCSADLDTILWKNAAAATLWGADAQFDSPLFSDIQKKQIQRSSADNRPYRHAFSYNKAIQFDCELTEDGCYLFTQSYSSLPGISELIENANAKHLALSLYDQLGELISQSKIATEEANPADCSFEERLDNAETAKTVWQKVSTTGHCHQYLQLKTLHGFQWRFAVLEKKSLSTKEWIIQLTEFDAESFLRREKDLESTLHEQEVIFENAGTGICYIRGDKNHNRTMMRCNQKYAEIFGYDAAEMIGQSSRIFYKNSQDYRAIGAQAYPVLNAGELFTKRCQLKRKDGSLFWAQLRGKLISKERPEQGYMWVIEDITDYIHANQALEKILNEQRLILDYAMVGIVFLRDRRVTRCNNRFEEIFGYASGELDGASSRTWYLTDEDWEDAGNACYTPLVNGEVFQDEMLLAGKDQRPIWCDVRSKAIDPTDLSKGSIWITMDITERKAADDALHKAHNQLENRVEERTKELASTVKELHTEIAERKIAEERVKHMALHDSLTSLPNRALMEERLEEYIERAAQQNSILAVMFIDLDRFKLINDSWGHNEGDQLLIEVANRLRGVITEAQFVARIGGDEFVILLPDLNDQSQARNTIDKIQNSFSNEVHLALQGVYVTPSVGVCFYPQDGLNGIDLLKKSDAAMYQAKEQGRNCVRFYEESFDAYSRTKAELGNALFKALKNDNFELHYQPQVDIKSNQVVGAEALIRWHHEERGLVSPAEFIPLAEETGLIVELGEWILVTACKQLAKWQQAGLNHITLSVNISALQVQQPSFVQNLAKIIDTFEIEPSQLELELTESILMKNTEETIKTLLQIHEFGIKISVDDFGTGYSSLSYLKQLPLDKLKIDRSFVNDITSDHDDALICRTIVSMAKNLNLQVIAEGVERKDQLDLLKEYGCEMYQGFLFSKPVPVKEVTKLITA
ncbi:EAL domain-containing protein [Neptuniibacter sp.]|uniref:sensor domain-containing protein n=1 Tax=Neptuniibacter sp. TaxID=1962643 RepID=UPI002626B65D|nr:EAL domain-containing protein [Neptuniibacter sp.]MCP4595715.1 EAL domain-containing protein [Neptuniibacter sp.]